MHKPALVLLLALTLPVSVAANGNHDRNHHSQPAPVSSVDNADGHSSTGRRLLVFSAVVGLLWCAVNKCLDQTPAADPEPGRVSVDPPPSFEVETRATRAKP